MTIRLLPRHAPPIVTTLALLLTLILAAGPATAQQAQQTLQLQRADGSTASAAGAPWVASQVDNLSQRGGGDQITITHSASMDIVPATGIACPTPPNSYFRVFDLSDFDEITGAFDVTSVDLGIEEVGNAGATTVNLYTLDGPFVTANLSLVGTATLSISAADNLSVVNVPITGSFSGSDVLVVEWAVPQAGVFFGGNELGQTGPTFIQAAACGATQPTDIATLGDFPNNAWVLSVNGMSVAGLISFAEARTMGPGSTVTVQGTVTRAKGAFTYFQDATGGLAIRQTAGDFFDDVADGTVTTGTRLRLTGTLSEFRGLLQINEGDLASYEILGQGGNVTPQAVTLQELIDSGEDYEAELVEVEGLTVAETGTFTAATSYDATDASATLTDGLRIPNADDTDVDGLPIPEEEFTFTGVVGQFTFDDPAVSGYQLLAIEETDIEAGPPPLEEAIHDTGDVQFEVYDFGELGAYADAAGVSVGTGFVFNGDNGLYESTFLVGLSQDQVSGDAYEFPDLEWATTDPLAEADPPPGFDQAFTAGYDDSAAANPIGVDVSQLSYSGEGDDYVIVEFTVENTSGADLADVYLGLFADWDIGEFAQNLGAYDEEQQIVYVYDDSNTSTNYFGIAALNGDEGINVSGVFFDALPGDGILYTSLTNIAPDAELPDDRRTVIGVGPYDFTAGESVTVRFAYVGGTDLDDLLANAAEAQAAVAAPPPGLDEAIHDTGLVQFEVYADGNLGTHSPAPFAGTGFVFDGAQGLFASTFVVGQSQDQVSGMAYETGEWVTTDSLRVASPPSGFDQAFTAAYDDSGAPNPIGLEIGQFSYSSAADGSDGFVVVEFDIENTSGSDLENIYAGVFADWDVGAATANLGDYDAETRLLYVYDDGPAPNYYGVAALEDDVSGYNLDAGGGTNPTEEDVFNSLTTFFPTPELPDDRRTVLGVGPYDIAAGESVSVRFAFVGGTDLDDIIANAATAQGNPVAVEETTPEGTFVLHGAYPNPFTSSATIGFTLPTAQQVRLTVYDVLGRRVATLIDGVRQAGDQTVRFDASSLPSGMYLYRLEAGSTQLTQRITLVR